MSEKIRPIDAKRNGPVDMKIGHADEGPIEDLYELDDTLFIIKPRAIYAVYLADKIDPDRENIAIGDKQQLHLNAGSESEIVARCFLTAKEIFVNTTLAEELSLSDILRSCFEITKNLLAADQVRSSFVTAQTSAIERASIGAGIIPALTDVDHRVSDFVQKLDAIIQSSNDLIHEIYKNDSNLKVAGYWDRLHYLIERKLGANDAFTSYAADYSQFCKFIRKMRNSVVHDKGVRKLSVRDFWVTQEGKISKPNISSVELSIASTPIDLFMTDCITALVAMSETLLVYLARNNQIERLNFPVYIDLIPEDRRGTSKVRYGRFLNMNGQLSRLS